MSEGLHPLFRVPIVRPELLLIACSQRHQIVGDVVRLLHLQEARNELTGQLTCKSSLQWRLSLAMELVASPALLIIHGAHPGEPWPFNSLILHAKQIHWSGGTFPCTTSLSLAMNC